ncbi:hypothetical protein [Phenylobacterium sp.]|uniref:hypothetical protein n=1 Tax=Phenylobacterium sp. TaxID=1871053 RepID=UPI003569260A
MRRSTFAILLLAGLALAGCSKRSSLYLDSGRSESSAAPPHADGPPKSATAAVRTKAPASN